LENQSKIILNLAQKWLLFAHIPADKSVVRQNALKLPCKTKVKIALNLAQKWRIIIHIPVEKSVVRRKCIKLPSKSKVKLL